MTCDEAKERAVIFRAMISNLVISLHDQAGIPEMVNQAEEILERYPFDPEALTVLRRMAEDNA